MKCLLRGLSLALALWLSHSGYALPPCDSLTSASDQQLCQQKVLEDEMDEGVNIFKWESGNNHKRHFHVQFEQEPSLIIKPGSNPDSDPAWLALHEVPHGHVILEEVDDGLVSPQVSDNKTHIRIKRQNMGESTLMIQLWSRSSEDVLESDGSGSGTSGNTTMTVLSSQPSGSSINFVYIIIPLSFFMIAMIYGWYMTITDIHDTYIHEGQRNHVSAAHRRISILLTCCSNLIPHTIFYISKRKSQLKNSVSVTVKSI